MSLILYADSGREIEVDFNYNDGDERSGEQQSTPRVERSVVDSWKDQDDDDNNGNYEQHHRRSRWGEDNADAGEFDRFVPSLLSFLLLLIKLWLDEMMEMTHAKEQEVQVQMTSRMTRDQSQLFLMTKELGKERIFKLNTTEAVAEEVEEVVVVDFLVMKLIVNVEPNDEDNGRQAIMKGWRID
jgi:hypothetical protein